MKIRKLIINILLLINLIVIITVFYVNIEKLSIAVSLYKIQPNKIIFIILFVVNLLLLLVCNTKKINYKSNILLISIFIIFCFCIPIYKVEQQYVPTGPQSHLMGVAMKTYYRNVYGIKILEIK